MIQLKDTKGLPDQCGVYIFRDENQAIYIGKSVNIRARVRSHIHQAGLLKKEHAIVSHATSIRCIPTLSHFDALILEASLIRHHKPKYNVVWKDDKNYLYIKVTIKDQFPKLIPVRLENDGGSLYFGPFKSSHTTQSLLYELRRILPFSDHEARKSRGCFYAKLGFCSPCPNTILLTDDPSQQAKLSKMYRKNIKKIVTILSGNSLSFIKALERQLTEYASQQKYEDAIHVRRKLFQFSLFLDRRNFNEQSQDIDELEIYSQFQEFLHTYFDTTSNRTYRIECYDISNLFGKATSGSMVVFQDGIFDRREYRKFTLRRKGISDIHMLEEVIQRRLQHHEWRTPDLIVLDGGTPQLRHIHRLFKHTDVLIPLIALAKRPDRIMLTSGGYRTVGLNRTSVLFRLFQALRDESHRFAKRYHVYRRMEGVEG
ncbi:hypothetical protein A3B02_01540 [Candidatus Roizmanbacteria bacterium RIFCSPLOWO2_01_FULL_42_14]|uniref:Excinuclease ABC subunit C n=1 Tax=Candidatus Roizmanbacteria bacterium RIFCSPLOWO2_01_FULL_42_14 TaxID=1802068 RepID=A0A1F7J7I7_9BACT|nr:MAG: hypothetical protein A3B02_01540 [Candidatus Roizmanbacteria bacterium RIFCSPLOWO2_01_FULL_42_14]